MYNFGELKEEFNLVYDFQFSDIMNDIVNIENILIKCML